MKEIRKELDEVIEYLKEEFAGIRVGRANAGLVENVKVDYYGSESSLKQVAQISVPDSKTIMISPWNKDDLVSIEKAITESDLNLNPNNNGEAVILNLPPMTEERRDELVKIVGTKAEEARVSVRKTRERFVDDLNKKKKNSEISEDEFFTKKEEVQEVVDEYIKKIEEMKEKKEDDVKTI